MSTTSLLFQHFSYVLRRMADLCCGNPSRLLSRSSHVVAQRGSSSQELPPTGTELAHGPCVHGGGRKGLKVCFHWPPEKKLQNVFCDLLSMKRNPRRDEGATNLAEPSSRRSICALLFRVSASLLKTLPLLPPATTPRVLSPVKGTNLTASRSLG